MPSHIQKLRNTIDEIDAAPFGKIGKLLDGIAVDADHAIAERAALVKAAQAVIERWETPSWKDAPATATYINALRAALASAQSVEGE